MPGADLYFNVAFVVVIVSLVVQGWSLTFAARKLDVALPRVTAPVRRVELDLPGQLTLEMVGYPVSASSAVMNGGTVPRWARPAFVIRNEAVVMPVDAGLLQVGDTAYYLAPPTRAAQLDGLFAEHAELLTSDEPFFGEFLFAGTVPLRELAGFYALKLGPAMSAMTIAALFASRFDDSPEVGDHLPLGTAVIVAREVSDGVVTRAGLQLAATPEDAAISTVRAVFARLRRVFGLR